MADKKISQLTALAASGVAPSTDVMAVVDTNVTETKKITVKDVVDGALNTQTANGVVYLNGSKEATAGSVLTFDGTILSSTTVDATNVEVSNVKAKDGTAAVTIADSTGAVTVSSGSTLNGGVVINELGADADTRIEGDTDANLFFVDASTDNVGIGTASPGAKLSVDGSAIFNDSGADVDFRIEGDTDANLFFVDASTDRIGIGTSSPGAKLSVDGSAIFNDSGADVDFRVESDTNTHALFVDAGNNAVKIGTSGTVWNTVTPIQIGTGAISAYSVTNNVLIASNWYYESADKYVANDEAALYKQEGGYHYFYTAPLGTAGAAMTLTERFRVELNGTSVFNEPGNDCDFRVESDTNTHALFVDAGNSRVGVNNSSPAQALDVTGNIQTSGTIITPKGDATPVESNSGFAKRYVATDTIDAAEKTRFSFTGATRRAALIKIKAVLSYTASNTSSNHAAAEYTVRVYCENTGAASDNSSAQLDYGYIYDIADYTFTNNGSFSFDIDIANPTGDPNCAVTYVVELISIANSVGTSGSYSLDSITTV